jgi:hypothetical protein
MVLHNLHDERPLETSRKHDMNYALNTCKRNESFFEGEGFLHE